MCGNIRIFLVRRIMVEVKEMNCVERKGRYLIEGINSF
jgi:hypothetical protein